ncbi:hypothetical protein BABINDRAFT_137049 [Babjeviella inositovora NRRL Y-12698]|uniref:Uncharacterized protein n=1 Tax=Babjeviella inositovora NRRL Y-12698 TaxID=984486 RepID=A0A1E3QQG7_9ASCO|nr:uncharacterized protein BABINDRAFT_137049 [Babjeviella inositovora NRRL Y-12698]ODQ79888.1 hypothetical protein BABINDRAFT_137049 [Babjeviella inositovora NRRL Y-12698]
MAHNNIGVNDFDPSDVILYVFCFILPPFSVLIRKGWKSGEFWASILLTAFFHLPGLLYSMYIVYITSPVTGDDAGRGQYADIEQGAGYADVAPAHVSNPPLFSPAPQQGSNPASSLNHYDEGTSRSDIPPAYASDGVAHDDHKGDNKIQR